jgi:hypothetical protein
MCSGLYVLYRLKTNNSVAPCYLLHLVVGLPDIQQQGTACSSVTRQHRAVGAAMFTDSLLCENIQKWLSASSR